MLVGAILPWLPRLWVAQRVGTGAGSPMLVGAIPPWLPRLWVAQRVGTNIGRGNPPVVAPVVGRLEGRHQYW